MDLTKLLKKDTPTVSPELLSRVSSLPLDNPAGNGVDLRSLIEFLMVAVGFNHIVQVNDCEDDSDYTESTTGTFDIASAAATGKRVGTNCMKLTATQACDGTQYVDTLLVNESAKVPKAITGNPRQMDWRDTRYLGMWIHAESGGDFGTDGEMKVAITYNDGTISDKVDVQASVGTVHQIFEVDMVAEGWDLSKVESLRFYCDNANAGEDLYIDDIIRYEVSYDRGPLYGCAFPIKSGTALVDGDSVKWTIDGLIKSTSSAAVTDLGGVKLMENGGPDAGVTGTAKRNKYGIIPSARIVLIRANAGTNPGDYLEWAANRLYTDVTTSTTENGTHIALEAAGAQFDDIMALHIPAGAAD